MQVHEIMMLPPWAAIVADCLRFAQMGYGQDIELWSVVQGKRVMSQEMFSRVRKNLFVIQRNHFPTDPHLKYVHINRAAAKGGGMLYVELTMLNFTELGEQLRTNRRGYALHGRRIDCFNIPLLQTRTCQYFGRGTQRMLRPRTLLTTIGALAETNIASVASLFDVLYGFNICREDCTPQPDDPSLRRALTEAQSNVSPAGGRRMDMRQIMSQQMVQQLEQCWSMDQVPLMALQAQMTMAMVVHMRQRATHLRMTNREFGDYVRDQVAENQVLEPRQ